MGAQGPQLYAFLFREPRRPQDESRPQRPGAPPLLSDGRSSRPRRESPAGGGSGACPAMRQAAVTADIVWTQWLNYSCPGALRSPRPTERTLTGPQPSAPDTRCPGTAREERAAAPPRGPAGNHRGRGGFTGAALQLPFALEPHGGTSVSPIQWKDESATQEHSMNGKRPASIRVLQHSEETLKTALISKNPVLVSQYEGLGAGEQHLMNEAFQPANGLFAPITVHSQSDWIISHPEVPQDFEQFFRDPYRKVPCPEKDSIYIQSIGSLGNTRLISEEFIKWLKSYCEAFFYGLTVKFLEPVSVSETKCSFRVNEHTQNLQIHAGHILAFLKKKKPKDAFCIMGITMIDLYPRDSWNFVFGQASLTDGVGIFSFARYGKDFLSSQYKGQVKKPQQTSASDYSIFDNYYSPEITSLLLRRSCKTLTHEIGHIFGMRHCQWLACLMQGSNHLEESDRRPLNLCPICLRKLQCALGFNIIERYKALVRWIDDECSDTPRATQKHSCENQGLPKPVEAFKEWREWIIRCIAVLQK